MFNWTENMRNMCTFFTLLFPVYFTYLLTYSKILNKTVLSVRIVGTTKEVLWTFIQRYYIFVEE